MFTGLIEGLGRIIRIGRSESQRHLVISVRFPKQELRVGESIAVNGVCLTVEDIKGGADLTECTFFASAETLRCTALGTLIVGNEVNLERAMRSGDRFGGHIVTGHVDAVGTVADIADVGASIRYTIAYPEELSPEIVPKGSIALDGISLTVNVCTESTLDVNIIPETQRATTVGTWRTGTKINMETDILGKYVHRAIRTQVGTASANRITAEMLRKNGFI